MSVGLPVDFEAFDIFVAAGSSAPKCLLVFLLRSKFFIAGLMSPKPWLKAVWSRSFRLLALIVTSRSISIACVFEYFAFRLIQSTVS